ncbi:MAG: PEGA domain-containing protein [Elusimicrobiota bacterium]
MAGSPKFVLKKSVLIILLLLNSAGLLLALILIIRNPSQNRVDETAYVNLPEAEEKTAASEKETEMQFPVLSVISKPEEAAVYIDGYHEGITPLEFPLPPEYENRSIMVSLLKEGYEKWEREISIEPGEDKEMKILLRKENETDK